MTVFVLCQLAWCTLWPLNSLIFCRLGVPELADCFPGPAWGCCALPSSHSHLEQLRHCLGAHHLALLNLLFSFTCYSLSCLVRVPWCHLLAVWVEQPFCSPPCVMLTDTGTNGRRKISGCISVFRELWRCAIPWNEACQGEKKGNIIQFSMCFSAQKLSVLLNVC